MDYTRLYLFRHGQVIGYDQRRFYGATDVGLTEIGIKQMQSLGPRMADIDLAAVYSSDLQRARAGGRAIAGTKKLELNIEPGFREHDFGDWEGQTFDEVQEKHPEITDRTYDNLAGFKPHGGESLTEMKDRVEAALAKMISAHPGANVALVAHSGVNRLILCHALGMELQGIFRIAQDHGCMNIIDFYKEDGAVVQQINSF